MYLENKSFNQAMKNATQQRQGYRPLYHRDAINHCPACGHTHWHVGRESAECAFCETAMPLAISSVTPAQPLFWFRGSRTALAA
jgi:hypothetical protein